MKDEARKDLETVEKPKAANKILSSAQTREKALKIFQCPDPMTIATKKATTTKQKHCQVCIEIAGLRLASWWEPRSDGKRKKTHCERTIGFVFGVQKQRIFD